MKGPFDLGKCKADAVALGIQFSCTQGLLTCDRQLSSLGGPPCTTNPNSGRLHALFDGQRVELLTSGGGKAPLDPVDERALGFGRQLKKQLGRSQPAGLFRGPSLDPQLRLADLQHRLPGGSEVEQCACRHHVGR